MNPSTRALPTDLAALPYGERAAKEAAHAVGGDDARERELRWALSVSILADVVAVGATTPLLDSSLGVGRPDWPSGAARDWLRRALARLVTRKSCR